MSKYPNEFAAWRVSFQSDRQAAESAFDDLVENGHELNQLDIELREQKRKLEQVRAAALELTKVLESYQGNADLNNAYVRMCGALSVTGGRG